jgi:hypothetical protein
VTNLGRIIVTSGIAVFTASSILSIFYDGKWFLVGLSIFIGSILAAVTLSIPTQDSSKVAVTRPIQEPPTNLHSVPSTSTYQLPPDAHKEWRPSKHSNPPDEGPTADDPNTLRFPQSPPTL